LSRWIRWLPASGLVAAIALALTGLISTPPPIAGAPANEIAVYFARHHLGLETESIADCVGVTLLIIFAATLHSRIGGAASLTAFVAAAIIAACTLVQVAAFQALAFRPNPDPVRAALLNDLQSFTFQVTTFPTLLFLGSAGAAILASSALPRWVGLGAAVAACVQVVAWISFYAPPGLFAAGGIPDVIAFTALLVWLVASSLTMLLRPPTIERL
jgi:hypothetical protein